MSSAVLNYDVARGDIDHPTIVKFHRETPLEDYVVVDRCRRMHARAVLLKEFGQPWQFFGVLLTSRNRIEARVRHCGVGGKRDNQQSSLSRSRKYR
jgi:hypothetical protein